MIKTQKKTKDFTEKMEPLVNIVKAGFVNINNINTSRRFFVAPDSSNRINCVDVDSINLFLVILEVIASGK